MKTLELFDQNAFVMSAEVFPPKAQGNLEGVIRALKEIKSVSPDFVSVTYGAGGEGARTTADVASVAIDAFGINTVAHITAVNLTKEKLDEQLDILQRKGVENILVLRGDLTPSSRFYDFRFASELAEYISKNYPKFNLLGACYPEKHPDAPSLEKDIDNLKRKIDAGVKHLISQMFFDNQRFYDFLDKLLAAGIDVPVEAGIMPLTQRSIIERTLKLSSAHLPKNFEEHVRSKASDEEFFTEGIFLAVKQIHDLKKNAVKGVHIYTMNKGRIAQCIFPHFRGNW